MRRSSASHPLRILVVEDHADLCYSLKLYLEMLGHSVHLASNRGEAREALNTKKYDLLVLDLVLSGEADGGVLELPPSYRGDVITMSAYGTESSEVHLLSPQLSGRRHLQKPFPSEELDFAIEECCAYTLPQTSG